MGDDTKTTPPAPPTGPDEPARRAEFDKWFTENIGKILADDDKSTTTTTTPAPQVQPPPVSSGLTLADVERFITERDKSNKQSQDAGTLKKALEDLTAKFDASEKRQRRERWFGLPFNW